MRNTHSKPEIHWLVKVAQELRDTSSLSLTSEPLHIDPDLAHPALSILGEFVDRCGFDVQPEFLRGYAFGLLQAGLIDEIVLAAIGSHIGVTEYNDLMPTAGKSLN